jgi:superfamily II DNA or RNA helicase
MNAAPSGWDSPDPEVVRSIEATAMETLNAYREAPAFIEEHANLERAAIEGGYGRRQLFELIQNGADEMLGQGGRVQVILTEQALYCANEGRPLSSKGAGALLSSYRSPKRGVEIGRFGLGFKSVLGITSRPEFYSRSASIVFDPDFARAQIERILPYEGRVPVLRIGRILDPSESDDPILEDLMSWATTVVRLPRDGGDSSWLQNDVQNFPAEFLLFAPHVKELVLEDRQSDVQRVLSASARGDWLDLDENGTTTTWRVYSLEHEPSDRARRDGGAMADRDVIPLVWAVPTRRRGVGEFWAFFPTLDRTTLSGVVNAPWKLNEDRTRIIEGPFNDELLDRLSILVIESAPELCREDDPGAVLDLMPARGREARGWADEVLTRLVNGLAKVSPSIPDQNGVLELPGWIEMHPRDIPEEPLALWNRQATHPINWAHPSVFSTERRAKAELYMEPRKSADVATWLLALIARGEVESSRAAVNVAADLFGRVPALRDEIANAPIIMDADGQMRSAMDRDLFLPAPLPLDVEADYVHPDLTGDAETTSALVRLGVREVETGRILETLVEHGVRGWSDEEWTLFWNLVRATPFDAALGILSEAGVDTGKLRVRARDGQFKALNSVLLPGEIVQLSAGDAGVAIDTQFHGRELRLLEALGAVAGPRPNGGRPGEPWFREYETDVLHAYLETLGSGARPNQDYLEFSRRPFAGPAAPLLRLPPGGRMQFCHALLSASDDLHSWLFGHRSSTQYPPKAYRHPVASLIRAQGILRTTLGPRTCKVAVGPAFAPEFGEVLPAARVDAAAAEALGLPQRAEELTDDHWAEMYRGLADHDSDRTIGIGYEMAARSGAAPPRMIRCRVGSAHDERPADEVSVTADEETARVLTETSTPYIYAPTAEGAGALVSGWGCRSDDDLVRSDVSFVAAGESELLGDRYPLLRLRLEVGQRSMALQPATDLKLERYTENGRVSQARTVVVDGTTLYYESLLEDGELLDQVSKALGLGLSESDRDRVLRNLVDQRIRELRDSIRLAADDVDRLRLAIGADELRARLPKALIDVVEAMEGQTLSDRRVAELALIVHGVKVLEAHKDVLETQGLEPPMAWAGSRSAAAFVRDLGFAGDYAGFTPIRVDRQVEVEGPPELGTLHDYQRVVVEDVRAVLRGDDGRRGLLSLPTGAGKTRVTIEAVVASIVDDEIPPGPVLWVAQTRELCEQAVQSWSEVWRAHGPRHRLTISRLWSTFEADEVDDGTQVVVASIQKLAAGVFDKPTYKWLSRASTIIVDEAHTSVGPSYTALLDWQGMGRNRDRAPLIGLTATPFRGINVEETRRLVSRYGDRRLDRRALGEDDPYRRLQDLGVLSQVEHRTLPGVDIELNPRELEELTRLRQLPDRAVQNLARNIARNETLLESVSDLDSEWPVLLFALSVEHAQTMAALFAREGIAAAAITGEMDRGLRMYYIDRFRRGDIRVLTNYAVLTAGFDAPRVRALYVARPVYTPNTYQQMIGRGLRGPRNGGTSECLLVNVADNVAQFGERLAFHEFDYLWER